MSLEAQLKGETTKFNKLEKEFDRIKVDRIKFETKAQAIEAELSVSFFIYFHFSLIKFKILVEQKVIRKSEANP